MHVTQTPNGKWIIWNSGRPIGPYDSKGEAESDMRGLERFEKYKDTPGYITSDKGTIQ